VSNREITLGDYPLVIEPTTESLEAKAGAPDDDRWKQLPRVPTHTVLAALTLPGGIVHFFGVSATLEENDVLLCYSTAGRLSHVMRRKDSEWVLSSVPAEVTGDPILKPSVRLVFEDERARASFIQHFKSIREGKTHNPTLSLLMDRLAEPVRIVDVWSDHER